MDISSFTNDRLLKLPEVIGSTKRGIVGYLPMSKSKWYEGIKSHVFPAPLRIGSGSFWRLSDIQNIINSSK